VWEQIVGAKKRGKKHPGVVLLPPNEAKRQGWRARYKDPDTRRTKEESLPKDATTLEARTAWAVRKSKDLVKRGIELEAGSPRATGTELAAALKRYFDAHVTLRERTLEIYRNAADKLEAWAETNGARSADDMTRAKLLAFREALIREPKRVAAKGKGKGRGVRVPTGKPRSPAAVNQELRAVRTVLGYVRDLDLFPKLTHDDLRRALKRLPVVQSRIEFLRPAQCKQLLEAALRHDAETYAETREEHAGKRATGTTPRYEAIAPLVLFVLTTGMRIGEAVEVTWKQVDLDALDYDGRKVGEIVLGGEAVKTNKGRTVDLAVSPALRSMLAAMKLASGGKGRVFALTRNEAEAAGDRLKSTYGAPEAFTWQTLRRTCGTYLTNAPGIFGAASAYRSARQLGHSVQVAEKAYLGVLRGIPPTARDVETAMQIGDVAESVVARVRHARVAATGVV
jgi:integrase